LLDGVDAEDALVRLTKAGGNLGVALGK
jgi:hypothetical protein